MSYKLLNEREISNEFYFSAFEKTNIKILKYLIAKLVEYTECI